MVRDAPEVSREVAQRHLPRVCPGQRPENTALLVLFSSGVPVKTLCARIGRSTPLVTMSIYEHLFAGDDEAAADTFAVKFALSSSQPWY